MECACVGPRADELSPTSGAVPTVEKVDWVWAAEKKTVLGGYPADRGTWRECGVIGWLARFQCKMFVGVWEIEIE